MPRVWPGAGPRPWLVDACLMARPTSWVVGRATCDVRRTSGMCLLERVEDHAAAVRTRLARGRPGGCPSTVCLTCAPGRRHRWPHKAPHRHASSHLRRSTSKRTNRSSPGKRRLVRVRIRSSRSIWWRGESSMRPITGSSSIKRSNRFVRHSLNWCTTRMPSWMPSCPGWTCGMRCRSSPCWTCSFT